MAGEPVNVRRLGPGDHAVAQRACAVFGLTGEIVAARFLARPEASLFVAEDAGEVIGWAYGQELVHPDGEVTMLLYALDVVGSARRRGVGTALVSAFVDDARARQCTEVWVLTDDGNPAGLATYAAAGGTRDPVLQVMVTWRLADGRHS